MKQRHFYCKPEDKDLLHYGVLGMKWGIRKQQNNIKLKDKPGNLSNIIKNTAIKKKIAKNKKMMTILGSTLSSLPKSNFDYQNQLNSMMQNVTQMQLNSQFIQQSMNFGMNQTLLTSNIASGLGGIPGGF